MIGSLRRCIGLKQNPITVMTQNHPSSFIDYLKISGLSLAARMIGIGIPSYYLAGNLPNPGMQWASGALTFAAILAAGRIPGWRAGGASRSDSSQKFKIEWFKSQREEQLERIAPSPDPLPPRGAETR